MARVLDVPDDVHTDTANTRNRNVGLNVTELRAQGALNGLLNVTKSSPRYLEDACFWKRYPAFAINDAHYALRHATPEIHRQAVSRTQDIIGTDRHIHGQHVEITCATPEDLSPEPF